MKILFKLLLVFILIVLSDPLMAEPQTLGLMQAESLIPKARLEDNMYLHDVPENQFYIGPPPREAQVYDNLFPMETVISAAFYYYEEQISDIKADMGMALHYAVNGFTGDVWDLAGCKRLTSPNLTKARQEIRSHVSPDDLKQFQQLGNLKPKCF